MNNNDHGGMEYDEFEQLLIAALQIFDQIGPEEYSHFKQIEKKIKSLPQEKIDDINNIAKEIGPKLAIKFDKNGDGVLSFDEFKLVGKYLREEYQKKLSYYK